MHARAFTLAAGRERQGGAFTLIELLVVVTIILLLLSILLPALGSAVMRADEVVCANNSRALSLTCIEYAVENDRWFPDISQKNSYWMNGGRYWREQLVGVEKAKDDFETVGEWGLSRQHFYGIPETPWNWDGFWYWGWNGTDPRTATDCVMGRNYFCSSLVNTVPTILDDNGVAWPAGKPWFKRRMGDDSYSDLMWSDLNREYVDSGAPHTPYYVLWITAGDPNRYGSNHLYGNEGLGGGGVWPLLSHVAVTDGHVETKQGSEIFYRYSYGGTAIFW